MLYDKKCDKWCKTEQKKLMNNGCLCIIEILI